MFVMPNDQVLAEDGKDAVTKALGSKPDAATRYLLASALAR